MIDMNAGEDPLELYFDEMPRLPLLSTAEVVALAQRLEQGDEAAFRTLVERNLRLVVPIAKTYLRYGVQLADLIQEGNLGLMHGARKYDWRKINPGSGKPYEFSTYVTNWIRAYIRRYVLIKSSLIEFPVHQAEQLQAVQRLEISLSNELGRDATAQEVAEAYNARQKWANKRITARRVEEIAIWRLTPTSLDAPQVRSAGYSGGQMDDDVNHLTDCLADPTTDHVTLVEHSALHGAIEQALENLSARERAIIRGRFGFDGQEVSLDTLAKRHKVTRQRILQVEQNALKKLFSPLQQWVEVSV